MFCSRAAALLALLSVTACTQTSDDPGGVGNGLDFGSKYADTVISDSTNGAVRTCAAGFMGCGTLSAGACSPHPALGPPDGVFFNLGPGDKLEVAVLCGAIIERGIADPTMVNDFKLWATVPPNLCNAPPASVEVSFDGSSYQTLDFLCSTNQGFNLQRLGLDVIRYVRVTNTSNSVMIGIDALEVL